MIGEFRSSGELTAASALSRRLPADALPLSRLPRMTPARLQTLKAQLAVESLEGFAQTIAAGSAETLPGVGAQTVDLWRRALEQRRPGIPI
ncbi:MAG: hypothetical protein ACRDWA_03200 [Acidimicrobiia bacterium]